ncbi:hypothetical protein E2C01_011992 [Portunus trituberculatus]|uniref:Uncharacterized protein n=1 Tax=Portunus trituberculatus TaxID=210409 RepID=A0A5B7DCZ3_PORTR|nr:hypothetical protein [Portunus trituberculatus]
MSIGAENSDSPVVARSGHDDNKRDGVWLSSPAVMRVDTQPFLTTGWLGFQWSPLPVRTLLLLSSSFLLDKIATWTLGLRLRAHGSLGRLVGASSFCDITEKDA